MFRFRKFRTQTDTFSSKIVEKQHKPVTIEEDGLPHQEVITEEVDITSPDFANAQLPSREDYSLENQLKAGLPLNEIKNLGSLLNNSEVLEARAEAKANEILSKTDNKE